MINLDDLKAQREALEKKLVEAPTEGLKSKFRSRLKDVEAKISNHQFGENDSTLPILERKVSAVPEVNNYNEQTRSKLPYFFMGEKYYTAEDLGNVLNKPGHWDAGLYEYTSGKLSAWVSEQFSDPRYKQTCREIDEDRHLGSLKNEVRFLLITLLLNPVGQIKIAGEDPTPEFYSQAIGKKMLKSSSPNWILRLTGNKLFVEFQNMMSLSEYKSQIDVITLLIFSLVVIVVPFIFGFFLFDIFDYGIMPIKAVFMGSFFSSLSALTFLGLNLAKREHESVLELSLYSISSSKWMLWILGIFSCLVIEILIYDYFRDSDLLALINLLGVLFSFSIIFLIRKSHRIVAPRF